MRVETFTFTVYENATDGITSKRALVQRFKEWLDEKYPMCEYI